MSKLTSSSFNPLPLASICFLQCPGSSKITLDLTGFKADFLIFDAFVVSCGFVVSASLVVSVVFVLSDGLVVTASTDVVTFSPETSAFV